MNWVTVLQVLLALSIFNVWLLRFNKKTQYRAGNAKTMIEEFDKYGLPAKCVWYVGACKLLLAALLLVGIWYPTVTVPAAAGLAGFMVCAIVMHLKVKDPWQKSVPATLMLLLALLVVYGGL
ncbi:MAG: DoxX family protein [Candidatus Woesearchaeota archaeon]|nr:DoxX family protein [Candidatus Woesearchaeota archaeon]